MEFLFGKRQAWPPHRMRGFKHSGAVSLPSRSRLALHIDADIDTVGERDDISAAALWLATQEHFDIVGLTTSAPDSNSQEWVNCINAYAADRPALIDNGKNPSLFKTQSELLSLVVQGVKTDNPSRGYWNSGESGYNAAHACAQLIISNAVEYGELGTDPTRKLWVVIQGGYTSLAQALHEAITLGQCPDILQRIRVIGQPNWNSSWAPNAWNYIFSRMWPAADNPGAFGDLWMLSGYLQWHAFNRDNGGSDTTFWNNITANSATGAHLRSTLTRPSGAFTTPHFRAGDAGAWFWLMSALEQGNFDPTNEENWCGSYQTYVGVNPWPSQTVGYGAGSGLGSVPNPEGVTYSPRHWAPKTTVNSFTAAENAVDLGHWYSLVAEIMEHYKVIPEPATPGLIGEWLFDQGSGSVVSDNSGNMLTANFGFSSDSETVEPTWTAEGLNFTPQQIATVEDNELFEVTDLTIVAVVKPDAVNGDRMILVRSGVETPAATGNNVFQFRIKDGTIQFLGFNGGTVTVAGGTVSVGNWAMLTAQTIGTSAKVRKNGVQTASGTLNAPLDTTKNSQLRIGARKNANVSTTDPVDGFDGIFAYIAIYSGLSSGDLIEVEQQAKDAVALRGIVI